MINFFETLFQHKLPEEFVELRFFNRKEIITDQVFFKDLQEVEEYINKESAGKNCYFGIHPRITKGGRNEDIGKFSVLYVDIDFKNFETEVKAEKFIEEKISVLGIFPTIIVDSGYGRHLYFTLDKRYEWDVFQPVLLNLITYFEKADSLKDKARIFRIPGTWNVKKKPYKECKILSTTLPESSLSLEAIAEKVKGLSPTSLIKKIPTRLQISDTLKLIGFVRKGNDRWEDGKCPKCGSFGLYIYDNNPEEVRCSHTGSCNFVSPTKELELYAKVEQRNQEAKFDGKWFVNTIKHRPPPIKMGYPTVDGLYKYTPGTFNLIASRLAHGKSSLAYNFILNLAEIYPESNFLFFSYEIPKELMYLRWCTIEYARATKKHLSIFDIEREIKKETTIGQHVVRRLTRLNNIFVYDDPAVSLEELIQITMNVPSVRGVFVDYIECVRSIERLTSEELRVGYNAVMLRQTAMSSKQFFITALSQINRVVKGRTDPRPTEADIRYSDKPMQESAIALGLYNPEMGKDASNKKEEEKNKGKKRKSQDDDLIEKVQGPSVKRPESEVSLEVLGLKNRFGQRKKCFLTFNQLSGLITETSSKIEDLTGEVEVADE